MGRYRLSPGATQVEMEDGTFIKGRGSPKRGVVIDATDRVHDQAIRRAAEAGHIMPEAFRAPAGVSERRCEPCNRSWWPWQTECPKCGAETTGVEETQEVSR